MPFYLILTLPSTPSFSLYSSADSLSFHSFIIIHHDLLILKKIYSFLQTLRDFYLSLELFSRLPQKFPSYLGPSLSCFTDFLNPFRHLSTREFVSLRPTIMVSKRSSLTPTIALDKPSKRTHDTSTLTLINNS